MRVSVTSRRDPEPLDLDAFAALGEFVLDAEDVPEHAELSVAVVDAGEMAALNERYRGKSEPTDVLAFPCDDPCPVPGDEPVTLGDVIVAPEIAAAQAAELGTTVEAELDLLLVHGILHLLGYTHENDAQAEAMQERESALLSRWAEFGRG